MRSGEKRMSKRERVEAALNLEETDRTPVYDILLNDAVIEHVTGRFPPTGEEGLKLKLQATAKLLDVTRMAAAAPREPGPAETMDADGFVYYWEDRWISGGIRKRPFKDVEGAARWVEKTMQPLRQGKVPYGLAAMDLKQYVETFRETTLKVRSYLGDDTVVLHDENGTGLDIIRSWLGLELFSYLWADQPDLVREYLDLYTIREVDKIHAVADPRISPCALTYGDIAFKERLMHSPEWLRNEFCPLIARLNEAWHEHGVKCMFHSDGDLTEIMPDLMATGIDGLNPIEVVAGMDLGEVKRLYGDKIFLAGGIDISQLMSKGTPDEVREACRAAIDVASPGYFIGSTTELDNGSKLENILAMVETAWEYPPPHRR